MQTCNSGFTCGFFYCSVAFYILLFRRICAVMGHGEKVVFWKANGNAQLMFSLYEYNESKRSAVDAVAPGHCSSVFLVKNGK